MPQETFVVLKSFNKYKTVGEKVALPNEIIGEAQIPELLESGHIKVQPKPAVVAKPAPAAPIKKKARKRG